MLTRQGWTVVLAAAVTAIFGRLLGIIELYLLAALAAALAIGAVVMVRLMRLRLEMAREVHPARIHAGSAARVEVRATNQARWRSPLLRLRDPVSGTRGAQLQVAPLPSGATARAAYRLPAERRGLVAIGPLTVEIADPFRLAVLRAEGAARSELTVFPRIETIAPPGHGHGRDPHSGADHPNTLSHQGDDFYALREYVVGDDLRRVHWPSTARHDELMVRQDELPWQGRSTIVLDVRRAAYDRADDERFESAVSAAASLVTACWRRRDLVRLVLTDGTDSGFAEGHVHVEALMEILAVVQPAQAGSLRAAVGTLTRAGNSGTAVVVAGDLAPGDLEAVEQLRRRFGSVTVVTFPSRPAQLAPGRATRLVTVPRGASFREAWNAGSNAVLRGRTVGATR